MKKLNIIGLVFLFAGIFAIAGFSTYKLFEDTGIPVVIRLGIVAIIIGIIIILISLIKERLNDKNL